MEEEKERSWFEKTFELKGKTTIRFDKFRLGAVPCFNILKVMLKV